MEGRAAGPRPQSGSMTHDVAGTADPFAVLASEHHLLDQFGTSRDGLPERYLSSHKMEYRYAFGRWWGPKDLCTSDVWVLLNPATGDTELRRRPTLEGSRATRSTCPAAPRSSLGRPREGGAARGTGRSSAAANVRFCRESRRC